MKYTNDLTNPYFINRCKNFIASKCVSKLGMKYVEKIKNGDRVYKKYLNVFVSVEIYDVKKFDYWLLSFKFGFRFN
jgi:hypothetical protein